MSNTTSGIRSGFVLALTCLLFLFSLHAQSLSIPNLDDDSHLDSLALHHDLRRRADVAGGSSGQAIGQASGSGALRMVSIVIDINDAKRVGSNAETHTSLHFAGTATDGPLRTELVMQQIAPDNFVGAVHVLDDTVHANPQGIPLAEGKESSRVVFKVQTTQLTNVELMDPATGKGVLWQTWNKDPEIRTGPGQGALLRTGQSYVRDLLQTMFGAGRPALAATDQGATVLMQYGDTYRRLADVSLRVKVPILLHDTQGWDAAGKATTVVRASFKMDAAGQLKVIGEPAVVTVRDIFATEIHSVHDMPQSPIGPTGEGLPEKMLVDSGSGSGSGSGSDPGSGSGSTRQAHTPANEPGSGSGSGSTRQAHTPAKEPGSGSGSGSTRQAHTPANEQPSEPGPQNPDRASGPGPGSGEVNSGTPLSSIDELTASVEMGRLPADGSSDSADLARATRGAAPRGVAFWRFGGVLSRISITPLRVLKGLGFVAVVAAVAFVIVDLIKGDYVAAAIGAAGIVAGAIAMAGVEAGVEAGLIASGPVGWIVGGIVALAFAIIPFLIPSHHEKPKPDRTNVQQILQWVMFGDRDTTGNENCQKAGHAACQALYGPGIVSHAFGWDNFDGFVYLIEFNKGFAMSIPDMAKTFHVLDSKMAFDGLSAAVLIDCQSDGPSCEKPKFILRRSYITIPVINDTADNVVNRIIPAPGGDCKLVADPVNGQHYPNYNITVTGQPAAIACGIVESQGVWGIEIATRPTGLPQLDSNDTGYRYNPSGNDSAGVGGDAYIAAPMRQPFRTLSAADGLICLGSTSDKYNLCLSNGTYTLKSGDWGAEPTRADSISMPAGATFQWDGHSAVTVNASSSDSWFHHDIRRFNSPKGDRIWVTVHNQTPDVVCLFAQELYAGDSACFGNGGDDLPLAIRKKAKSMTVHGNAVAWVYADHYGDVGGTRISTNVPDLASIAYGADQNFSSNVVAMWISVETGTADSTMAKRSDPTPLYL